VDGNRQQRRESNSSGLDGIGAGFTRHPEEFPRAEGGKDGQNYRENPVAEVHDGDARGRGNDREDDAPCQLRHV